MDVFCSVCGKRWDMRDENDVRYQPAYGDWSCTEEGPCGLRAADAAGYCSAPGPGGLACQRPAHDYDSDKDRHAAVQEW